MKKRSMVLTIGFFWLLLAAAVRLVTLTADAHQQTATGHGSISVTVSQSRGTIYDRNLSPMTNSKKIKKAVLTATPEVTTELYRCFSAQQADEIIERLKSGKPVVAVVPDDFSAQGAQVFEVYDYYGQENLAPHLIGYRDAGTGKGISGIEKAFDNVLTRTGEIRVRYATNARGGTLLGVEPEVIQTNADVTGGVVLTADIAIQRIAEEAVRKHLTAGCAVVLDATGENILAMASMPDFSPNDVAKALEAEDSPFINRALNAYNVGSVFKLCVAAAALEAGISPDMVFECTGSTDCSGVTFHCHKKAGHGTLNMQGALEQSCNVYFIRLAQLIGAQKVNEMALLLGFGKENALAPGLVSGAGVLPQLSNLESSSAALANFSIGQGDLLATPLQIASMTAAIVNAGAMVMPSLTVGIMQADGTVTPEEEKQTVRAMSVSTAQTLHNMMISVVADGMGAAAAPATGGAGGKTATAETGREDEQGNPVLQAWFTGFYPAEQPQYIITVFAENATSGSVTAAPVFKEIADGLAQLAQ